MWETFLVQRNCTTNRSNIERLPPQLFIFATHSQLSQIGRTSAGQDRHLRGWVWLRSIVAACRWAQSKKWTWWLKERKECKMLFFVCVCVCLENHTAGMEMMIACTVTSVPGFCIRNISIVLWSVFVFIDGCITFSIVATFNMLITRFPNYKTCHSVQVYEMD